MAKILHSADAPKGKVRYSLLQASFELEGDGAYETNDRALLASAETHPWLKVEYDASPLLAAREDDRHVPYEDDYLSAPNSRAFDLKLAESLLVEQEAVAHVAIDAAEDQTKKKHVGDVAITIAAADADTAKAVKQTAKESKS